MQCLYKHLLSQDDGIFTFYWQLVYIFIDIWYSLREECPNTEFFLVRIFLYSVRIQKNTDQTKLRILTVFTQWEALTRRFSIKYMGWSFLAEALNFLKNTSRRLLLVFNVFVIPIFCTHRTCSCINNRFYTKQK